MSKRAAEKQRHETRGTSAADRDVVALGIATAALILFVGTGGSLMPKVVRAWLGNGPPPDSTLATVVLLNIALLIFGWRRYTDLLREVVERRRAGNVLLAASAAPLPLPALERALAGGPHPGIVRPR